MGEHEIINGDLIGYLRGNQWLVQNGFLPRYHAILCDPPYGLAFMGKKWDDMDANAFQVWVTEWATLLLDYVYPGAVGLFFGGTRTYHRLTVGLEDAGWEIADSMCWVYGSGFPKSHNVSKALDREAGAKREVVGRYQPPGMIRAWNLRRAADSRVVSVFASSRNNLDVTTPATKEAARWNGYGTALKPAYEPVVVARAPRGNHNYTELASRYSTGALHVDGGRVDAGAQSLGRWPANFALICECVGDEHQDGCPVAIIGAQSGESRSSRVEQDNGRRYSTNRIYGKNLPGSSGPNNTYSDSGTSARFFYVAKAATWEREAGLGAFDRVKPVLGPDSSGGLGVSNSKTMRANVHPTVKPIAINEYLARLILPPAGDEPRRLLIPFSGSGSEMIGALLAGWDTVTGIERDPDYTKIARARIAWWSRFPSYAAARARWQREHAADEKKRLVVERGWPTQLAMFDEQPTHESDARNVRTTEA